jgi:Pyocin activator protein PrtN
VSLNTAFLLMAQYNGRAIVPLEEVCRDYFSHLTPEKLLRKVLTGEIEIPIIRIEHSQKSAKGIHLQDLADYLDKQRAEAIKNLRQLHKEFEP